MSTPLTSTASALLSDALQRQIDACYDEVHVTSSDDKQREIDACYNALMSPPQQEEAVDARQRLIDACYAPAPPLPVSAESEPENPKRSLQEEIEYCYALAQKEAKLKNASRPVFTATAVSEGLNVWKAYANQTLLGFVTTYTQAEATKRAKKLYYKKLAMSSATIEVKAKTKAPAKTAVKTSQKVYGRDVILSHHALVRFRKRAMSGVGSLEAAEKLLRLQIDHVVISKTPPSWQRWHRKADGWIGTSKHSLPLMKDKKSGKYIALTFCHYNMMKLTDAELARTGRKVTPKAKRRARL